ncbi:excinuclease ABC subunit B [Coraliomargarita sinensis]|uniref:Excinuclease ABC subunit B n=1 Tax=Coraliomargarita sinensis TaxID=2174842 RepID=A0A317ZFT0_9BACT|nr:UvrB/UvrC motif-containing protein [Coraliomargarita sinensis]PXA04250.1 excinuclease ABC subunit B [Coraliomargarita sinensis]
MGENLKCSNCDNQATVHLTQIINNKIIKVDLCESCAQAKGVTDPEGFSLADLLNKSHVPTHEEDSSLQCPDCGLTTADFRRTGRLGCSSCFTVFASLLRPVLEDMHVGTCHKGKTPDVALSRQSITVQLDKLEKALAKAIDEEAYEDAAKYRDQIKSLKEEAENYEYSQS